MSAKAFPGGEGGSRSVLDRETDEGRRTAAVPQGGFAGSRGDILLLIFRAGLAVSVGHPVGKSQNVVGADMVIPAQKKQSIRWQRALSGFVIGVILLGGTQKRGDLCLGFIGILPQIPDPLGAQCKLHMVSS